MSHTCEAFEQNLHRHVCHYLKNYKSWRTKCYETSLYAVAAITASGFVYFAWNYENFSSLIGKTLMIASPLPMVPLIVESYVNRTPDELIQTTSMKVISDTKSAIESFTHEIDLKSYEKRKQFWDRYDALKRLPISVLTDRQKTAFEAAFKNYESAEKAKSALFPTSARKKKKQLAWEAKRSYTQLTATITRINDSLSKIFDLIKDDGFAERFIQDMQRWHRFFFF